MIDVDFVMRSDFHSKPGGDLVQVEKYRSSLQASVDSRLLSAGPHLNLRPDAILHVVNIDRPFDFLSAMEQANGRPVVVSPIHHERRRVAAIGGSRRWTLRRAAERVLPEATADLLKYRLRTSSFPGPLSKYAGLTLSTPRLLSAVGEKLREADAVLLLGAGEGAMIEQDYSVRLDNTRIVPNGVDLRPHEGVLRDIPILVPGRVEPRKNQVAIARVLTAANLPVTFVGAVNENDKSYARKFFSVIAESHGAKWLDAVPHDRMAGIYSRAKVVLNLSHVEVLSLVDLEAYACGCRLITTLAGHTREWLGDGGVTYVDPTDLGVLPGILRRALRDDEHQPDETILHKLSWSYAARQLERVYVDLDRRRRTA